MRLTALALAVAGAAAQNATIRPLGAFSVQNAAFVVPVKRNAQTTDLLVSQFTGNPLAQGTVTVVPAIQQYLDNVSQAPMAKLDKATFAWPNEVGLAPPGVFADPYIIVVPDGFLVPGKATGNVYALKLNPDTGEYVAPVGLATTKSGYFYHMVEWIDVDGDGLLDIVSARATKPIFGPSGGELVWLRNPGGPNPLASAPWATRVISAGPDVMFALDTKSEAPIWRVYASQFFSGSLVVYRMQRGSDGNLTVLSGSNIDASIGPAYDVKLLDLDGNGMNELLVTNHVGGNGGGVYAYEIPADVKSGAFPKHVLASGFKVTEGGFNQAAPGFAYPFTPRAGASGPKWLAVAGDGSQRAYVMRPIPQSINSSAMRGAVGAFTLKYEITELVNVNGVVGSLAVGDFLGNNDGWTDIAVPNYDAGYVTFFTYAPHA